jgi:hypothetical protein
MSKLSQAQAARIRYIYQLIEHIIYESLAGTVEDVHIDLKNELFDSKDFNVPKDLFKSTELFSDGPRLVFPWTEVSESFLGPKGSNGSETSPINDVKQQEFIIDKGDRLFINRVELLNAEAALLGCNIGRRNVYFSIKRRGEDAIEIDRPLLLKPKNELWERGFTGNYYNAVRDRIEAHFKIDNAYDIDHIEEDNSFSYRALRKLGGLVRLWGYKGQEVKIKADCLVVLPTFSSDEEHDKTNIWLTINDAVAMGYFWAKAEDQRNRARLEESTAQKSDAGHRSGDSREEHAEKWKRVFQARVGEIWTSATKKPTRTKMIEIILNDREKWDATRQRLNLDAVMPGRESLRKEIPKVMRMIERTEGKEGKERVRSPD